MLMNKKWLVVSLALSSMAMIAGAEASCTDHNGGFLPKNDLQIRANPFAHYAIGQDEFNAACDKIQKFYADVFAKQGRTLKINRLWDDATVNASAERQGSTSVINMYGGLARHPKMTADGFQMVICHELGHHLGGAPKVTDWASDEGQSDYFATLKCAREVWGAEDNAAVLAKMSVPSTVTAACQKSFSAANDVAICERASMAGFVLGNVLADLGKEKGVSFDTPDTAVVSRTDHEHPAAQCRLDTYFAGSVCDKSKDIPMSDTDATIGSCASQKGDTVGTRPLCWYSPTDNGSSSGGGGVWPH